MSDQSLLGLFAHPDDEQLMSGAFARAAKEGMRTGLICATRGEAGEISDPALSTPENLGHVREHELRAAATVLGVKYLWFLDYRDSGMAGTPENGHRSSFLQADRHEALGKIIKIVRDFRPTVMVTFDPTGGYGHPDHLTISQLSTQAFGAAADPNAYPETGEPWQAARLFYASFPRSTIRMIQDFMRENDVNTGLSGLDPEKFGIPDEEITNVLDVSEWVAVKSRSLAHHRTQMAPDGIWQKLSPEVIEAWRSREHYALAAGVPVPDHAEARGDLFAGLR